jgi:hypothetical protein
VHKIVALIINKIDATVVSEKETFARTKLIELNLLQNASETLPLMLCVLQLVYKLK